MFEIVINVMTPVLFIGALGYALQKVLQPPIGSINQLVFYVLAPCLTFSALKRVVMTGEEIGQIVVFGLVFVAVMSALGLAISALFRWERGVSRAFIISMLQINGNYAYSVSLLALGLPGLDRAVIFSVIQGTVAGTVSIFFASNSSASVAASIVAVFRRPSIYATALALAMKYLDLSFPEPIHNSIDMLGTAAIPIVLVIMGMQIGLGFTWDAPAATVTAVVTRLIGSGVLAFFLSGLFGMSSLTRHVMVLYAAMPTAIMTTVIATEFNARPRFVAGVVVITTAFSVVTVSLWLTVLSVVFP